MAKIYTSDRFVGDLYKSGFEKSFVSERVVHFSGTNESFENFISRINMSQHNDFVIYLGQGAFRLSSPVNVFKRVRIIGNNSKIISSIQTGPVITFYDIASINNVVVENTMEGYGSNGNDILLRFMYDARVENCILMGGRVGIFCSGERKYVIKDTEYYVEGNFPSTFVYGYYNTEDEYFPINLRINNCYLRNVSNILYVDGVNFSGHITGCFFDNCGYMIGGSNGSANGLCVMGNYASNRVIFGAITPENYEMYVANNYGIDYSLGQYLMAYVEGQFANVRTYQSGRRKYIIPTYITFTGHGFIYNSNYNSFVNYLVRTNTRVYLNGNFGTDNAPLLARFAIIKGDDVNNIVCSTTVNFVQPNTPYNVFCEGYVDLGQSEYVSIYVYTQDGGRIGNYSFTVGMVANY